jgi:NAD(P)-dependent dehydrogenase (short-subunit alcohol dehydrogenase family)
MRMFPQMFSLTGLKALITGGSRGIGLALAQALKSAGATVVTAARNGADIGMDVSDTASCRSGVAEAVARMQGLDILVNNAGIEQVSPSLDVDEALWDRILDTNLKGAFFASQAAAKAMKQGVILNICSLTSERGIPTAVPYGSSKSGLAGMTRALAAEWAPRGVRVNALEPGYFRTALTENFYRDEAWQQAMLARVPMGRFGELDDLTGAAIFLCSDAARYITGVCLPVDGGTLAAL